MVVDFNDVRLLHLELTTVCNAKCPQCARENPSLYDKKLDKNELTLGDCKQLIDVALIKQLDKLLLCGNFGDPVASQDMIEVCEYVRTINPDIIIGINTNGSLQNTDWWKRLGMLLAHNEDYCVFSIDGLGDTNSVYRIGTTYDKIIENAVAFIDAGGSAHWDMLVYEHNQHQVGDALIFAKELGFSWFRTKVSKRFKSTPVEFLKPPSAYNHTDAVLAAIDCNALNESSIYMAANGKYYPCCWIGTEAYTDNLLDYNFNKIPNTWNTDNPYTTCKETCSKIGDSNVFNNQWQENIELSRL
jgi:MoaA/NifB/PqqE/SkfB family radical SAM enzyme